jgi:hypothetical protein
MRRVAGGGPRAEHSLDTFDGQLAEGRFGEGHAKLLRAPVWQPGTLGLIEQVEGIQHAIGATLQVRTASAWRASR